VSCFKLEAPGSEVGIPSFEADVPGSEVEFSSFKVNASSSVREALRSKVGIPGSKVGRRGLEGDRPALQRNRSLCYSLRPKILKDDRDVAGLATTIEDCYRCISEYLPMQYHRESCVHNNCVATQAQMSSFASD
jgi:hypothetical protein